jgi:hypothetical protein
VREVVGDRWSVVGPGTLINVLVEAVVDDIDFAATMVGEASLPPTTYHLPPTRRSLPIASVGAYGR